MVILPDSSGTRRICDDLDLTQTQAEREGFILNVRDGFRIIHKAGCEAVGAIAVPVGTPKVALNALPALIAKSLF